MRGIVFLGNRQLEIREFADPVPGPGQAVVAMRASGLCGSDLTPYRGTVAQTAISGHEPCGQFLDVIAALGGWCVDEFAVVAELGPLGDEESG